ERDITGPRVFEARDPRDLDRAVALEAAPEFPCEISERHGGASITSGIGQDRCPDAPSTNNARSASPSAVPTRSTCAARAPASSVTAAYIVSSGSDGRYVHVTRVKPCCAPRIARKCPTERKTK